MVEPVVLPEVVPVVPVEVLLDDVVVPLAPVVELADPPVGSAPLGGATSSQLPSSIAIVKIPSVPIATPAWAR